MAPLSTWTSAFSLSTLKFFFPRSFGTCSCASVVPLPSTSFTRSARALSCLGRESVVKRRWGPGEVVSACVANPGIHGVGRLPTGDIRVCVYYRIFLIEAFPRHRSTASSHWWRIGAIDFPENRADQQHCAAYQSSFEVVLPQLKIHG